MLAYIQEIKDISLIEGETCYGNSHTYDGVENYKKVGWTILEFEDIDLK